ncbi:MAG: anti-sigma regulatory factor, partial [Clostridia bacterium]|nr:anti-sigma regulatory factor [Clostridia bacterium]
MNEALHYHFDVDGANFSNAGRASVETKKLLRQLGVPPEIIRRISVAMYEGEINMVIHAHGGDADVYITEDTVLITLKDV